MKKWPVLGAHSMKTNEKAGWRKMTGEPEGTFINSCRLTKLPSSWSLNQNKKKKNTKTNHKGIVWFRMKRDRHSLNFLQEFLQALTRNSFKCVD